MLWSGIYTLTAQQYHADPCVEPSLSSSIAELLLEKSPEHARYYHPRLNKECPDRASRKMDLGSAAHDLLLGKGNELVILEFENYKKKDAQQARDFVRASGKVPILVQDYELARRLAERAAKFLEEIIEADAAVGHLDEAVLIWQEPCGCWCRAMIDRLYLNYLLFIDYKTTGMSAEPRAASAHLYSSMFHMQAAFYERGLNVLFPEGMGRRRFLFLFQECEPPFGCSMIQPDEAGMTLARKQVMAAIGIWHQCMTTNRWPGYAKRVHYGLMPVWMERDWMAREEIDPRLTGETGVLPAYDVPTGEPKFDL